MTWFLDRDETLSVDCIHLKCALDSAHSVVTQFLQCKPCKWKNSFAFAYLCTQTQQRIFKSRFSSKKRASIFLNTNLCIDLSC